ncbi:MAG: DUF2235 domain-containing protein [Pseudorhodobacter sp.]
MGPGLQRGRVDHVIILDGTMSKLIPGGETNAGKLFRLLTEQGRSHDRTIYYEPGLQVEDWRHLAAVAQGKGINRQIRRAYGYLASHYHQGDRIFLIGYSRGAYAVRSLAGAIDRVGLLRREFATERNVHLAYRHYQRDPGRKSAQAFHRRFCHDVVPIEMVGVWDTVKALGLRLPVLWKLTEGQTAFHNAQLGPNVRHGFHALAIHETRVAYIPILWNCPPGWEDRVEQVWFRGAHSDVGGQVNALPAARPLANIPLVWMLERLESCEMTLPSGWRARFPCDATAPMVGAWRGWAWLFWLRKRRVIGKDRSERIHPSALGAGYDPKKYVLPPR